MTKTGIGLYGTNGHQITNQLVGHPAAELVAVAAFGDAELPDGVGEVARYDSLEALLADDRVELVSLCSPLRSEQARHAIACMKAGKHVYAEKPCAMTEADLDARHACGGDTGRPCHAPVDRSRAQPDALGDSGKAAVRNREIDERHYYSHIMFKVTAPLG